MQRSNSSKLNYTIFAIFTVLILVFPVFIKSTYYLGIIIFIGINTIVAMGLCLLMGYAGQVSLGHAAFYGIGAYISSIFTLTLGIIPAISMVIGAVITGAIANFIGIPIFKLKGHFLAMATLGFGIIVQMVFVNWVDVTGGPSGLTGIPYMNLAGITFDRDSKYYYLVWTFTIFLLIISYNIVNSRVGRALRSIHGSEVAASSLGVDTAKYKVQIFTLSAVFASLAGSLYAHYITFVNPSPFGFKYSIELVVMVVVGGALSIWGSLIGAGTVTLLTEFLRSLMPRLLGHASGEYEIIFFGIILMVMMIFMPGGITGKFDEIIEKRRRNKYLV